MLISTTLNGKCIKAIPQTRLWSKYGQGQPINYKPLAHVSKRLKWLATLVKAAGSVSPLASAYLTSSATIVFSMLKAASLPRRQVKYHRLKHGHMAKAKRDFWIGRCLFNALYAWATSNAYKPTVNARPVVNKICLELRFQHCYLYASVHDHHAA